MRPLTEYSDMAGCPTLEVPIVVLQESSLSEVLMHGCSMAAHRQPLTFPLVQSPQSLQHC